MALMVLTGASGAGKTAIAQAIAAKHASGIEVFFFDSIGVPSPEEMNEKFGSPEAWQWAATEQWMARLQPLLAEGRHILLEGQARFAFLIEAAKRAGITNAIFILVDCDDQTRARRLTLDRRGQPELANPDMMNWAAFLRQEALQHEASILDTSILNVDQGAALVMAKLDRA